MLRAAKATSLKFPASSYRQGSRAPLILPRQWDENRSPDSVGYIFPGIRDRVQLGEFGLHWNFFQTKCFGKTCSGISAEEFDVFVVGATLGEQTNPDGKNFAIADAVRAGFSRSFEKFAEASEFVES